MRVFVYMGVWASHEEGGEGKGEAGTQSAQNPTPPAATNTGWRQASAPCPLILPHLQHIAPCPLILPHLQHIASCPLILPHLQHIAPSCLTCST